ncbi:MAG: 16S rRNA (cytidine(1402)-2'-O)-methyltransferase [Comamonas sp.]
MSASFASALTAAHEAASAQHYPPGALYVVATPIGNLADISLRALHVLKLVDSIACEDTRHTQGLLRSYGLERPGSQLLALHQHNEAEAAQQVIARLQQGQRLAYVSDAGTPGVSDPGARLAAAVQAAGLRTIPLPGASSITAALSVAGAVAPSQASSGFLFAGFLASKQAERATQVQQLGQEARCCVLLEAPHRIGELAQALSVLGARPVTLAREITKQFEEIVTQPADQLPAWLDGSPQRSRGEFVVVLHPVALQEDSGEGLRVLRLLLAELPTKAAVRLAAEITGAPRNALYDAALQIKREGADEG